MRVFVDARAALAPTGTGIGQYARQLVRHLPLVDPDTTYVSWPAPFMRAARRKARRVAAADPDAPSDALVRGAGALAERVRRLAVRHEVPRVEWIARFDVLFAPNFVPPPTRKPGLVVTVHDLAFRLFPQTASRTTLRWLSRMERGLALASRVIVPSEHSRCDLIEALPVPAERVVTVPLGVDRDVFRPAPEDEVGAVRARFGIDGPYLLSLGGIEPRKNLRATVLAFASLPDGVRPSLVVAGPVPYWYPDGSGLLREALEGLPSQVRDRVVVTGFVSERDKVALLTGAEALVYPSLYEGFGLPVLEAMACDAPVLTSDASALPETAGDAALFVEPEDTDAIASGMERILTDSGLRRRLRGAGRAHVSAFTWPETARRTAQVLHQAHEER